MAAFTIEEMELAMHTANDSKSATDLPLECLKYAGQATKMVLLKVMKDAYLQQKIPDEWMSASIKLIYKSGDKLNPANYCPISITEALYWVLMKMITTCVNSLLEVRNVLTEEQGGF